MVQSLLTIPPQIMQIRHHLTHIRHSDWSRGSQKLAELPEQTGLLLYIKSLKFTPVLQPCYTYFSSVVNTLFFFIYLIVHYSFNT